MDCWVLLTSRTVKQQHRESPHSALLNGAGGNKEAFEGAAGNGKGIGWHVVSWQNNVLCASRDPSQEKAYLACASFQGSKLYISLCLHFENANTVQWCLVRRF